MYSYCNSNFTYGSSHASGLVDSSTASEERNYKDDAAQYNEQNRCHADVNFLEVFFEFTDLQVNGDADGQNGDAA